MKTKFLTFPIILTIFCVFISTFLLSSCGESNNQNSTELTITANDIAMEIGETTLLTYDVSIKNSLVYFEIENPAILSAVNFSLQAIKEGKTTIKLFASYQKQIASYTISVTITAKTPLPDDKDDDKNNDNPDTPTPSPDNPSDENNENYIEFEIVNQKGCTIDKNKITIAKDTNCYFRLTSSILSDWSECIFETPTTIILSKLEIGMNTWEIFASEYGEIKIILQDKCIAKIIVEIA